MHSLFNLLRTQDERCKRKIEISKLKEYYEEEGKKNLQQQYFDDSLLRNYAHLVRRKWILRLMEAALSKPNSKVLDIGCSEGYFTRYAFDIDYTAIAVGAELARSKIGCAHKKALDKRGLHFIVSTATDLPFKSGTFDLVIVTEVLEHVPDYAKAIEEVKRVSKRAILISLPGNITLPVKIARFLLGSKDFIFFLNPFTGGHVNLISRKEIIEDFKDWGKPVLINSGALGSFFLGQFGNIVWSALERLGNVLRAKPLLIPVRNLFLTMDLLFGRMAFFSISALHYIYFVSRDESN